MTRTNEVVEQKELVLALYDQGELAFQDAMDRCPITLKKGKSYFWSCLLSLGWGSNIFFVALKSSGEYEGDEKKVFASPEEYALMMGSIIEGENECANVTDWRADPNNSIEIDKGLTGQGLIQHGLVHIIGDIEQGVRMREQLYFFGQRLGKQLLNSEFDRVCSSLFENRKLEKDKFIADFRESSEVSGQYEFSEVEVGSAYAITDGDQKVFDEMKTPKGVKREQRRGQITIRLASMFTPNGIPLWYDELQLDVISNEKGLLKVSRYNWILN
jgi:hypothetical protein